MGKRIFDVLFSVIGLLIFGLLIFLFWLLASFDTQSNGFFLQKRIGQFGKPFYIIKLKSMRCKNNIKTISRFGDFIRSTKIDEWPQLINILIGNMSVVGPRPDISGYYDFLQGEERKILELKPGLTSAASLKYGNEEYLLSQQQDPLTYNDTVIFPDKVRMNLAYYYQHSFLGDLRVVYNTIFGKYGNDTSINQKNKISLNLETEKNTLAIPLLHQMNNTTMTNSKIWLSSPHMGGTEQKYVQEAFDTNWVAPLGPNVTGLEQDLENYLDQNVFVGALSSGTAAIHLGLILLGVKAGDEVICQSMTFSASANPILYQGALPVFIDSEPETWNMSPEALEEAIIDRMSKGAKPKAIIVVHLYGMPYNVTAIQAIADKYQIPILEDSAEALGSSYKGQKCGTFGDICVLSFNGNKIITTSGGGAIVAKTKETKEKAVFFATQSRDNAPHYQHSEIGYNYRMSNICAGIGRGQMEVLDNHVALRRKMNQFYYDYFAAIDGVVVLSEPNSDYFSNHWLSAIVMQPEKLKGRTREDLRFALEQENIECRPLWKPMHLQPVFQQYPYYGNQVAERLFEDGLCLPSGSNTTEIEKERIIAAFDRFFKPLI